MKLFELSSCAHHPQEGSCPRFRLSQVVLLVISLFHRARLSGRSSGASAMGETNYKQTGGSEGHSKAGGHLHPDPPGYDVAEGEPEVWAANRMLLLLGCTSKEALRLSRRASSSPQGLEIMFWKEGCWQSVANLVHQ